jgi:hypothetical protein
MADLVRGSGTSSCGQCRSLRRFRSDEVVVCRARDVVLGNGVPGAGQGQVILNHAAVELRSPMDARFTQRQLLEEEACCTSIRIIPIASTLIIPMTLAALALS